MNDYERLVRLFTSREPREFRNYLAVARPGQKFVAGSTTPLVGSFARIKNGLWIPEAAGTGAVPLDFAKVFVTMNDLTGVTISLQWLQSALRRVPLKDLLHAIGASMAVLRRPTGDGRGELDESCLQSFSEPTRTTLSHQLRANRTVHAPQLLMVLAKMAIATCPEAVPDEEVFRTSLAHLLLVVGDHLAPDVQEESENHDGGIPLRSQMSAEFTANHLFNASLFAPSQFAVFQRRWMEMPKESPSKYLPGALEDLFVESTGVSLRDQTVVGVALFSKSLQGQGVIERDYLGGLNWTVDRLGAVLKLVSLPLADYRERVADELNNHKIDWFFNTFARYPLVDLGSEFVILDPDLLLKRFFGWLPIKDIEQALRDQQRSNMLPKIRNALDEYSERYVLEQLAALTGNADHRLYTERTLRRAYKGLKTADAAIDYGNAWVVVEVSTRQVRRDTVHAVSIESVMLDRDGVIEEAEQVAASIESIRKDETRLRACS